VELQLDDRKAQALRELGIDDSLLDELLGSVERIQADATSKNIEWKNKRMPSAEAILGLGTPTEKDATVLAGSRENIAKDFLRSLGYDESFIDRLLANAPNRQQKEVGSVGVSNDFFSYALNTRR
jgi:hypothetical protein